LNKGDSGGMTIMILDERAIKELGLLHHLNFLYYMNTGGSVCYSSPCVALGRVYVGSYDNNIYCLYAG